MKTGSVHIMLRDLNADGTDVGPMTLLLLKAAVAHQRATDDEIVVSAGFSPDFPNQPRTFAEMAKQHLEALGATDVKVLTADHFSSFGELAAYHKYCVRHNITRPKVLGYRWHLLRVLVEARQVGGKEWAKTLHRVPVDGGLTWFDVQIEPLKWFKLLFPRRMQLVLIKFFKLISPRTSY